VLAWAYPFKQRLVKDKRQPLTSCSAILTVALGATMTVLGGTPVLGASMDPLPISFNFARATFVACPPRNTLPPIVLGHGRGVSVGRISLKYFLRPLKIVEGPYFAEDRCASGKPHLTQDVEACYAAESDTRSRLRGNSR